MKKIPILIQLITILCIVLIIPMTILSQYFSRTLIRYSEEEIVETEINNLKSDSTLTEKALFNVIDDTFKIVQVNRFKHMKDINTYEELNSSYDNIIHGLDLYHSMKEIQSNNKDVYSAYFYLDQSDYVISTNKGIVPLKNFESLEWLNEPISERNGASGVWFPRKLNKASLVEMELGVDAGEIDVVSYVYRLNSLTTTTRGTIVINFYENAISNYLNPKGFRENKEAFIMNNDGYIISHSNKECLYDYVDLSHPVMQKILKTNKISGYYFCNEGGDNFLYTYYRLPYLGWTFVNTHRMDQLMQKSNELLRQFIVTTIIIILIGTLLSIAISYAFSKPIRQLVKDMKKTSQVPVEEHRNELAYITEAVDTFQKQEMELRKVLKSQEKEAKKLAIHNLLQGEIKEEMELNIISNIFPHEYFMVILMEMDHRDQYLVKTSSEIRRYKRNLLYSLFDEAFQKDWVASSARYKGEEIAIILNTNCDSRIKLTYQLEQTLLNLKERAKEILGHTVTFGVSELHRHSDSVKESVFEALEAVKKRMLQGGDHIFYYEANEAINLKFHYFYNSENKIINYLDTGDSASLTNEISALVTNIKNTENISNENILLIFNQLIGAGIKYLADYNINASKVFGHNTNMYTNIENMDTIEDIAEYVNEFFQTILNYTSPQRETQVNYFDLIHSYIQEHYHEDFLFEDLAEKIGISYSYMRKIVKDETGKSLIDNLNIIRLEKSKELLQNTQMNVTEIALKVGYRNVQSLNRFFKKYEGISPNQYRKQLT